MGIDSMFVDMKTQYCPSQFFPIWFTESMQSKSKLFYEYWQTDVKFI